MMMEAQGEVSCKDHLGIMKGKRTKRQRSLSPLTLAMASSSCSGGESEGELGGRNYSDVDNDRAVVSSSPVTPGELAESTEEEEDMANCLMLLAQGQRPKTEPLTTTAGCVYQCKTCNRCFPSFQALGGHRASHKKPKVVGNNEEKKALNFGEEEDDPLQFNMSTALSLQIPNRVLCNGTGKASKIHECSVCGAEFSSGQALGGHMRRHRTFANPTTVAASSVGTTSSPESQASKKSRNLLQLDLNLPAPEEESKFSIGSKEKLLVFSASSLVDCHY
ncbi:hypothetical protein SLE2022_101450 [Rubroshorea leprosula]